MKDSNNSSSKQLQDSRKQSLIVISSTAAGSPKERHRDHHLANINSDFSIISNHNINFNINLQSGGTSDVVSEHQESSQIKQLLAQPQTLFGLKEKVVTTPKAEEMSE